LQRDDRGAEDQHQQHARQQHDGRDEPRQPVGDPVGLDADHDGIPDVYERR
jgi:hypothetical protein